MLSEDEEYENHIMLKSMYTSVSTCSFYNEFLLKPLSGDRAKMVVNMVVYYQVDKNYFLSLDAE